MCVRNVCVKTCRFIGSPVIYLVALAYFTKTIISLVSTECIIAPARVVLKRKRVTIGECCNLANSFFLLSSYRSVPFRSVWKLVTQIDSPLLVRSSIPNSEPFSAKTNIFAVFLSSARNSDRWILTPLFLHDQLIQILAPRERPFFEIQLTDIWVIHYPDVVYLLIRKKIFIQVLVG